MASMFAIRVLLKDLDGDMNGLDALDWRRAHYLSDGSLVKGGYHPGVREIRLDVTEAFARRYFPHDARSVLLTVHPDVTAAGDLTLGRQRESLRSASAQGVTPYSPTGCIIARRRRSHLLSSRRVSFIGPFPRPPRDGECPLRCPYRRPHSSS